MTTQDELASIRQRAEAATAGPWRTEAVTEGRFTGVESHVYSTRASHILLSETDGHAGQATNHNAEFVAHARTDIPRLLGALDAVLARHQIAHRKVEPWATGYRWTGDHCAYDGESWPCRTVAAVNKALEASK